MVTLHKMLRLSAVLMFIVFIIMMTTYPAQSLQAAIQGVGIWWDVLFPALFPFFMIAELLLSFGIVHFFGTLLDPLMRPLFRVPGIGGFVMAMGFASGYPVGARLTSQLWEEKLVNREEGERLVAFTSTSDPIFLIGAVAVGFFYDPGIAIILSIAHYGAGVIVGLLMRFHARKLPLTPPAVVQEGGIFFNALRNMHHARLTDKRPLGVILREAAIAALRLIFVIGGLVVFFSVLIELLSIANILQLLTNVVSTILTMAGLPAQLAEAFINGLFEVTLGSKSAGSAEGTALIYKAAGAAFILSWAGLSVHAQIVSLMSRTGMRYLPFVTARLLHGIIAMWIVIVMWNYARPESTFAESTLTQPWLQGILPALERFGDSPVSSWLPHFSFIIGFLTILILVGLSLLIHCCKFIFAGSRHN